MLCAMEPGTQVAIHRHLKTSESLAVIRGVGAYAPLAENEIMTI